MPLVQYGYAALVVFFAHGTWLGRRAGCSNTKGGDNNNGSESSQDHVIFCFDKLYILCCMNVISSRNLNQWLGHPVAVGLRLRL